MSRRHSAEKRQVLPDAKYGNKVVAKFINIFKNILNGDFSCKTFISLLKLGVKRPLRKTLFIPHWKL